MGLAASQARFLLLSSRQSDVELRMQSITNQKLALQRQSGDIAAKYQRAMNATNLYWDDNKVNYSTITSPSSTYMLTDSYGAVVLDNNLACMLNDPSLPASGSGSDFEALYPNEEKFLKAITNSALTTEDINTVIAENDAAQEAAKNREKNNNGKIYVNYQDSDILANCGSSVVQNYYTKTGDDFYKLLDDSTKITLTDQVDADGMGKSTKSISIDNLDKYSTQLASAKTKLTTLVTEISTALADGYYNTLCANDGPMSDNPELIANASAYAKQATLNQYIYGEYDTDATTTETDADMSKKYWDKQVGGLHINELDQDPLRGDDDHWDLSGADEGHDLNTIDFVSNVSSEETSNMEGSKDMEASAQLQVYPKEIIETYMNYFDLYMAQYENGGIEEGATIGSNTTAQVETKSTPKYNSTEESNEESSYRKQIENDSTYRIKGSHEETNVTNGTVSTVYEYYTDDEITNNINTAVADHMNTWRSENTYVANITTGYTSSRNADYGGTSSVAMAGASSSSNATAKAQYYMKLYNALCTSGWVTDAKVNNSDYLENQLMYGNYIVGNMKNYTEYRELSVTDSDKFSIEDDEDATEQARVEYEAERDNLDYKEALLDAQLDSLTTEREEITTEKESVQELINENVKKFKLFA